MLLYLLYTLIFVIIIFVIVSTIFRKNIYKEVDRLEEWKNTILNRGIPDEIGKVKKLHMAGETEEKFEAWRNDWDEIAAVILPELEENLFDIEELSSKNRFRKAKQLISLTEERLNNIDKQLDEMLEDIDRLVKSEEQNRTEIEDVRLKHKEIRSAITKKRGSLGKGLQAFDRKMDTASQLLDSFDQETAVGSYLKARAHLVEVIAILEEVEVLIEDYPKLLVQIETSIPAEVKQIRDGMIEMEQAGYQLEVFEIDSRLDHIEEQLVQIKEEMKVLQCESTEAELAAISEQLEQLYDILEYEVESKQYVIERLESCKVQLVEIESKLDALTNEMMEVQQSYYVSEEQIENQKKVKSDIVDLTKQLLVINDVVENNKQTFTSSREMVDEWSERLQTIDSEIEAGKTILFELREDEWEAEETLRTLKETMFETKRLLNRSNIPGLPERTLSQIALAEEKLIKATNQLDEVPLKLGNIKILVEEANEIVEQNAELIKETIHTAEIAERVIQYGNRYRNQSEYVKEGLKKAEELFRQFEYEEALECATDAVKDYEPDVIKRVEDLISV